jgi:hypothetical protein
MSTGNISASGYNTSKEQPDGFLKAKAFVTARKGTSNKVEAALIRNAHPDKALILNSVSEAMDRLGGTYSLTENYSFVTNESSESKGEEANLPSMQTANILLTYGITITDEHGAGQVSMELSGNIAGSKDPSVTWSKIKEDFKSRDFYSLVNKAYKRHITGVEGTRKDPTTNLVLNESPVSFSISPNEVTKSIGFQLSYDNNDLFKKAKINYKDSYFDYNLSFEHDNVTDIIQVSCQGNIITRGSLPKKVRDNRLLLDIILKNNSEKVRDEAQKIYHIMFPTRIQYVLAPRPNQISVSEDVLNGTITYSASFTDRDFPENSKLRSLDYGVAIVPAKQEFRVAPSCLQNGHYLTYDLNLDSKRATVSINTNATADDKVTASNTDENIEDSFRAATLEAKSVNRFLQGAFVDGQVIRLDSENKVENKDDSSITYSRAFSHEKSIEALDLNRLDN